MSAGNGTTSAPPPATGQVVLLHDTDGTVRRWTIVQCTGTASEIIVRMQPA